MCECVCCKPLLYDLVCRISQNGAHNELYSKIYLDEDLILIYLYIALAHLREILHFNNRQSTHCKKKWLLYSEIHCVHTSNKACWGGMAHADVAVQRKHPTRVKYSDRPNC